ncbi:MAG: hypothetical protein ACTHOF_14650 [Flavisolibacter sp.]
MAKQKGIFKIEGTLDDVTFFKTKDGYLVRQNNPVTADRIATDPAFQRTRENGAEFGRAGKAGKTLRTAFRSLLQHVSDSKMVSRLTTAMMKVIQADTTSERGLRNVIDGEAALLKGFDFNENGKLGTTLFAPFTATIDRVSGALTVEVPSFVPANAIAAPAGATHYKMLSAGAAVDFENGSFEMKETSTAELPIDGVATTALELEGQVTAASTKPLFVILGIEFYQQVNGTLYPLKNGAYNALQIVAVEG